MNNLKTVALHGAKVAGHIIIAALVVGLSTLLSGPGVADKFGSALLQFGVPVALTNIVFAMVLKFIQAKAAQINVPANAPTDNTPPTV
jgi:hypothetical protein